MPTTAADVAALEDDPLRILLDATQQIHQHAFGGLPNVALRLENGLALDDGQQMLIRVYVPHECETIVRAFVWDSEPFRVATSSPLGPPKAALARSASQLRDQLSELVQGSLFRSHLQSLRFLAKA